MAKTRKVAALALFFLLFWLAVMLLNIWAHEIGHAVAPALRFGTKHSLSHFGATTYTDWPTLDAVDQWLLTSGESPESITQEAAPLIFEHLGRESEVIVWGTMGGWVGQIALTLILLILTQTAAFKSSASPFSQLFLLGYIIINMSWMGGNWFLQGAFAPRSSDPTVLINVLLNRNPVAIGVLWIVAILFVLAGVWLGWRYGERMFTAFGLSGAESRRLAASFAIITGIAGTVLHLPTLAISLPIILLLVTAVPTWIIARANKLETIQIPGLAWQGTLATLALFFLLIFSNSGFVINGHSTNKVQGDVGRAHYCEQSDECLPDELEAWYGQE